MKTVFVAASAIALLLGASSARAANVEAFVSTDDVRACAIAKDGTIWLATTGGLARVRDQKIDRVLTKLDGLLDGRTNALALRGGEGGDGTDVWVGTEKGLNRLKIMGDSLSVASSSSAPSVRAILERDGVTYVATFGGGVRKLDDNGALVPLPFLETKGPSARVRTTSLADFGGTIVAGTAGAGLYRLVDGKLVVMPVDGAKSVSALGVHDGRLFVGALDGTISLAGLVAQTGALLGGVRRESSSDVRAFTSSGASFFAASFGDGMLVETKTGFTAISNAPDAPDAKWMQGISVSASNGNLRCVGTPSGAFVSKGDAAWTHVTKNGASNPPSNDVTTLARLGDRIYAGTYDRGVASFSNGAWSKLVGVADDARVDTMLVDGKRLFVGTTRGLVRIDGQATTTFDAASGLPSNEVHALAALGKSAVLVGTAKGAAIVDGAKVIPLGKKQGLAIDAAWAVARGPHGSILVGASTGLYVGKLGDAKWRRLSVTSGDLPDDWVTALAVHGDDVFVGTYAGGVAKIVIASDDAMTSSVLAVPGGGSINVGGLNVVGAKLYAATMDGLFVRALDGASWKDETRLSLGTDVTATLASPDGLWIASRRGVTHVAS